MIEPAVEEESNPAAAYGAEVTACASRNPGSAIFFAVGIGLLIGLIVRALRPDPRPPHSMKRMLEDIECRLWKAAGPVMSKAGALAHDGVGALQSGAHSGEAQLGKLIRRASRQVRHLLS